MNLNAVNYRCDLFIVHAKYTLRLSNLKRSIPFLTVSPSVCSNRSNINSGHICRSECPCLLRYNFPTIEFRMVYFGPCVFDYLCKLNLTYKHGSYCSTVLVMKQHMICIIHMFLLNM